jgi:hypothetical protein
MKKYSLAVTALLICFSSQAQFRFGVKAGYNNATVDYKKNAYTSDHSISGFQAGVFGEFNLNRSLLLTSHIIFNQKGNVMKAAVPDNMYSLTYRLNYLETNLLLAYKIPVKNLDICIGAGPYLGAALSGAEKGWENTFAGERNIDRKVYFSNTKTSVYDTTYFKSFDAGIDLNASVKYKKYQLYFNFSKGFTDRTNIGDADWSMKNKVFTVGLGYYFK